MTERERMLVIALEGLKRGDCFCEVGIDNPMMGGKHSAACDRARTILFSFRPQPEPESGIETARGRIWADICRALLDDDDPITGKKIFDMYSNSTLSIEYTKQKARTEEAESDLLAAVNRIADLDTALEKAEGKAKALRESLTRIDARISTLEGEVMPVRIMAVINEVYQIARAALAEGTTGEGERPRIVCLCGSTRFYDTWQKAIYEETMKGNITLQVGFYPHSQVQAHGQEIGCTSEQKIELDELHKRKIDLADEILVLNVGGYIGESTRSEIAYAEAHGKPARYLEALANEAPEDKA